MQMIDIKEYRINTGDFVLIVSTLSDTMLPEGSSIGEESLTISPIVHFEEY